MNNIFQKRFGFLPANFIVLGIMLAIGGALLIIFYSAFWYIIIAITCMCIALFIFTIQTGIIISFSEEKVLRYWGPFKMKFGKWIDVSNVKYVAVVSIRLRDHFSTNACTYTTVDFKGKINLIMGKDSYITLYQDKKKKALKDAKTIARGFKVRIYDNSEGKKHWLDSF